MISACKFCGQTAIVDEEDVTETEAVEIATLRCKCDEALKYGVIQQKAEDAKISMEDMYQKEGIPQDIILLMINNLEHMKQGIIQKAQYSLPDGRTAAITLKGHTFVIETKKQRKTKTEV